MTRDLARAALLLAAFALVGALPMILEKLA